MSTKNVSGRRTGAALIDLALYTVLCVGLFFLVADSTEGSVLLDSTNINLQLGDRTRYVEGGEAGVVYLLDFALALLYFGLLPGLTGWTIGKLMTGIRVVRADRRRAGVGRNLVRPFCWIVDGFPYFIPGLVGFILVLATNEHRRVADFVAGTYVVDRAEVGVAPVRAAATAAPAANWYPRSLRRPRHALMGRTRLDAPHALEGLARPKAGARGPPSATASALPRCARRAAPRA